MKRNEFKKYDKEFWEGLDTLIKESKIVIDRPRDSAHPKYPDMIYPVDYGYLSDTSSMDGGGIDIWIGSKKKKSIDSILCIVDRLKKDSEINKFVHSSAVTHGASSMVLMRSLNKNSLRLY